MADQEGLQAVGIPGFARGEHAQLGTDLGQAGHAVTTGAAGLHVPQKELVGTLQLLVQARWLHIARSLPQADLLVQELQSFRARLTVAQTETALDWRERPHDDLVLAVALAAGLGEACLPPREDPLEEPEVPLLQIW